MHHLADPVASPRSLLYYVLMIDLSVFNEISAYVVLLWRHGPGGIAVRRCHQEHDLDVRNWLELPG